jgi:hypothetical protein
MTTFAPLLSGSRLGGVYDMPIALLGVGRQRARSQRHLEPELRNIDKANAEAPNNRPKLLKPGNVYQQVVKVPVPSLHTLPQIENVNKRIGAGGQHFIFQHPTDPTLVVKISKTAVWGRETPEERQVLMDEHLNLRWLEQGGIKAIESHGLVRIHGTNTVGLVLTKVENAIYSKDYSTRDAIPWVNLLRQHGKKLIKNLEEIESNLNRLGVVVGDLQFCITAQGQIILNDPLKIYFVPHNTEPNIEIRKWVGSIKADLHRIEFNQTHRVKASQIPLLGPPINKR